jgi:lactoylglutathione lyase
MAGMKAKKSLSGHSVRFLHSMIRVEDLESAVHFFSLLNLHVVRRTEHKKGRFTLVFLSTKTEGDNATVELTHNWDQKEPYTRGRNFGHLAFAVPNIYELCTKLVENGVTILRPPRDGRMAFVRSPDDISIELLQEGEPLQIQEPWSSMKSLGTW